MRRKSSLIFLLGVAALAVGAAELPPYTRWSPQRVRSILTESPWAQRVVWTRMVNTSGLQDRRVEDMSQDQTLIVHVQLFSSRPIRQAYAAASARGDVDRLQRLHDFANREFPDEIVISWLVDSEPKGSPIYYRVVDKLHSMALADLAADTFLATSRGRRVQLAKFIPPTPDGTGAKFVFPRQLPDGSPLLSDEDKSFTFQAAPIRIVGEEVLKARGVTVKHGVPPFMRDHVLSLRANEVTDVTVRATFKVSKLAAYGQIDY
jgi:hypothetical protein